MQPAPPIIVKVVDPPQDLGLGDVILNAVGLTGVMAVFALIFGCVVALLVISYRKLQASRLTDEEAAQTQSLGLTPPSGR